MADPILPATPPTITQSRTREPVIPPSGPDTSAGIDTVQKIFDKVLPAKGGAAPPAPPPPVVPAVTPEKPPPPPETPEPKKEAEPELKPAAKEPKMPSFLEEALRGEPAKEQKPAPPPEEEMPDELPTFKTPEESKKNWKKWRSEYKNLKEELKKARETPPQNQEQAQRLAFLENQNREMAGVLTRVGVEQSAEFQNNIIRPLHAAWNEAARIVQESGADPQDLAKAMSLSGKSQFEALDNLFAEMPESAKAEVHDALRQYRRFEDARRAAVANAPATFEGIRKRELERQYAENNRQREDMRSRFDKALQRLRDEAQVEIFRKTDDPEAQWWNDQSERMVSEARNLYLENTDLDRVAMACLLAPAADVYRKLWMIAQKKAGELQKIVEDRFGNEPTLSESPGNAGKLLPDQQTQEDLKRPFHEVFLREFHRARSQNR